MTRAENPSDAVSICLDTLGRLDLPTLADLLDTTPDHARDLVDDLVFDQPGPDGATLGLVPRAEYLSGNVRDKLKASTDGVLASPEYQVK